MTNLIRMKERPLNKSVRVTDKWQKWWKETSAV